MAPNLQNCLHVVFCNSQNLRHWNFTSKYKIIYSLSVSTRRATSRHQSFCTDHESMLYEIMFPNMTFHTINKQTLIETIRCRLPQMFYYHKIRYWAVMIKYCGLDKSGQRFMKVTNLLTNTNCSTKAGMNLRCY